MSPPPDPRRCAGGVYPNPNQICRDWSPWRSSSADGDLVVVTEAEVGSRVALVLGETDPTVGVLVEQDLARLGLTERGAPADCFDPGRPFRVTCKRQLESVARRDRSDRRFQVVAKAGQLDVAERVHVDDRAPQGSRLDGRVGDRRWDELARIERPAERLEGSAGREMRRRRGEDVATVEARADLWQSMGLGLQQPRLPDPTELLGPGQQQPVVRPDQHVAPSDAQGNRPSGGSHAWIDDRDVNPDRQIRQGAPQQERPVPDGELPDLVADVDDPRLGRDRQDDPVKDRRRRIARTKIGQQRNKGPRHDPRVAAKAGGPEVSPEGYSTHALTANRHSAQVAARAVQAKATARTGASARTSQRTHGPPRTATRLRSPQGRSGEGPVGHVS